MYIYEANLSEWRAEYLYKNDNYLTVRFFIKSNGFYGEYNFCLSLEKIYTLITDIKNQEKVKRDINEFLINDSDSDSFIKISQKGDNYFVSGQLGSVVDYNSLKFSFKADFTVISCLYRYLSSIINICVCEK